MKTLHSKILWNCRPNTFECEIDYRKLYVLNIRERELKKYKWKLLANKAIDRPTQLFIKFQLCKRYRIPVSSDAVHFCFNFTAIENNVFIGMFQILYVNSVLVFYFSFNYNNSFLPHSRHSKNTFGHIYILDTADIFFACHYFFFFFFFGHFNRMSTL